jgi:hypothetical protein
MIRGTMKIEKVIVKIIKQDSNTIVLIAACYKLKYMYFRQKVQDLPYLLLPLFLFH